MLKFSNKIVINFTEDGLKLDVADYVASGLQIFFKSPEDLSYTFKSDGEHYVVLRHSPEISKANLSKYVDDFDLDDTDEDTEKEVIDYLYQHSSIPDGMVDACVSNGYLQELVDLLGLDEDEIAEYCFNELFDCEQKLSREFNELEAQVEFEKDEQQYILATYEPD